MQELHEEPVEYTFKVLIVGEPNAGKTAFVNRYVHDTFSYDRISTKGVDFASYKFQWNANTKVNLNFWDVAGQERVGTQTSVFFRGAHAAMVVYDVTDEKSREAVPLWKRLLDDNVTYNGNFATIPTILLANKIDLVTERSEDYDPSVLNLLTSECHFSCGIPITACGNYNIAQSVKKLVELLLIQQAERERDAKLLGEDDNTNTVIILDGLPVASRWSTCRC